jgi:hypothetical protein
MIVTDNNTLHEWANQVVSDKCQLLIHVIPEFSTKHPADNRLSVVMMKRVDTGEYLALPINRTDYPENLPLPALLMVLDLFERMKIRIWGIDQKTITQLLRRTGILDINLYHVTAHNTTIDVEQYYPIEYVLVNRKYRSRHDINSIISLSSHVQFMNVLLDRVIDSLPENIEPWFLSMTNDFIPSFSEIESCAIKIDREKFGKYFSGKEHLLDSDAMIRTQYNVHTVTGRPSNRFGGINFAALSKDDGARACIVSRYNNGQLILIDYSAYHPHLIAKLINYNLPADAYHYFAKYYFNTDSPTEDQVKDAKQRTFAFMYGNVPQKYRAIPFFSKMEDFIAHRWDYFERYGYVESGLYKRPFYKHNIVDATPTKLFNYMLQRAETEYNVDVINDVINWVKGRDIKPILYTYDSMLFDVAEAAAARIPDLIKLMTKHGFPVKTFSGKDYNSLLRL